MYHDILSILFVLANNVKSGLELSLIDLQAMTIFEVLMSRYESCFNRDNQDEGKKLISSFLPAVAGRKDGNFHHLASFLMKLFPNLLEYTNSNTVEEGIRFLRKTIEMSEAKMINLDSETWSCLIESGSQGREEIELIFGLLCGMPKSIVKFIADKVNCQYFIELVKYFSAVGQEDVSVSNEIKDEVRTLFIIFYMYMNVSTLYSFHQLSIYFIAHD